MSEEIKAEEPGTEVLEDAAASAEEAPEQDGSQGKKPGSKKRLPIVIGVVVAVLVVAVGGGLAWHEQPSFCGAICHTPMNGYLETYEAEPGQAATDKWGNEVADASGMMAAVHRKAGEESGTPITCLSCHEPTLSEQLTEGLHWVTGSYNVSQTLNETFVPEERDGEQLTEARGTDAESFCLKSGCHVNDDGSVMTKEDLEKKTADKYGKRNPHATDSSLPSNHTAKLACTDCHKAHRASVMGCSQCHSDATIPDGWVSGSEGSSLEPTQLSEDQ